jgi:hypothetical protein
MDTAHCWLGPHGKRLMVTSIGVGENGEYENMGAHCAAGTSPLRFFGFGDIFYQAQILS